MRVTDLAGGPFTPPGFYYKTFIKPRRLWPLYEKVLRHAAASGCCPSARPSAAGGRSTAAATPTCSSSAAAPAGLHAALAAARLGADVVLADEGPEPGGRLLADRRAREGARARRAGPRGGRRVARAGGRARLLRRADPGLGGRHAASGPRPPDGLRHRDDRAAARLRGQRPAGRDARGRRAPARRALRRPAGAPGRGGDDVRPRPRGGARAAGPRRGDRGRRRPAGGGVDRRGRAAADRAWRCCCATRSSRPGAATRSRAPCSPRPPRP